MKLNLLDATHVKMSVIGRNEANAQTSLKQMKPFRRLTRRTIEDSALMDDFVLRGDAAAALAASLADAAPASQKKRHRQTTIHHGDKVVSQERVQYLKEEMDDAKTTANMLSLLEALEQVFVSLEMLEKTKIGVALTRLSRRAESDAVKDRAQKLLKVWKNRAKKAMRRRARRVETYGRNYAE